MANGFLPRLPPVLRFRHGFDLGLGALAYQARSSMPFLAAIAAPKRKAVQWHGTFLLSAVVACRIGRVIDAKVPMQGSNARQWVMRQFIAAAMATGLVGLWAVLLPFAAQPAHPAASRAPALSEAMFLCQGPTSIDRTCAAALARALVSDAAGDGPGRIAQRACVNRTTLTSLARRD
jgi:hypothetical protein